MEITIAGQTWMFLMAVVLGAALGVCYDVFRVLRVAVSHPPVLVAVEDLIFSAVCAVATLLYLIYADCGEIRLFVLIGEAVGFALYYCTVGALVIGAAKGIAAAVRRVFRMLYRIFVAPVLRAGRAILRFWAKILRRPAECLKRKAGNSKLHLKKHSHLLYNLNKRLHGNRQKNIMKGQGQSDA